MDKNAAKKYYEKLPCKYDPNNEGIVCCPPRRCKVCGWNPSVAKRRKKALA